MVIAIAKTRSFVKKRSNNPHGFKTPPQQHQLALLVAGLTSWTIFARSSTLCSTSS
jgi:hypothetical protein